MNKKNIWFDRQGKKVEIDKMDANRFHNLVNYLFIESQTYNLPLFNFYLPVILQELTKRQLSVTEIVAEGPRPYQDDQGINRIWDEETNTELAMN